MAEIAYKVVSRGWGKYNAEFISATASGKDRLVYRIGETTTPKIKGSKIFVFKFKTDAEYFCKRCSGAGVIKVKAENLEHTEVAGSSDSLARWWSMYNKQPNKDRVLHWESSFRPPTGTCFADSVKCIKFVKGGSKIAIEA